jgi:hypothetical protein
MVFVPLNIKFITRRSVRKGGVDFKCGLTLNGLLLGNNPIVTLLNPVILESREGKSNHLS